MTVPAKSAPRQLVRSAASQQKAPNTAESVRAFACVRPSTGFRLGGGASNCAISAVCRALPLKVSTLPSAEMTMIAILDVAGENHLGQRIPQVALDHPLQGDVRHRRDPSPWPPASRAAAASSVSVILRSSSSFVSRANWISTIRPISPGLQAMEQDDLVDTVKELGPEMRPHHAHHPIAHPEVSRSGRFTRNPNRGSKS